jgi:hypothetical protein
VRQRQIQGAGDSLQIGYDTRQEQENSSHNLAQDFLTWFQVEYVVGQSYSTCDSGSGEDGNEPAEHRPEKYLVLKAADAGKDADGQAD